MMVSVVVGSGKLFFFFCRVFLLDNVYIHTPVSLKLAKVQILQRPQDVRENLKASYKPHSSFSTKLPHVGS